MAKYKRKPIEVEAVQVVEDNGRLTFNEMPSWLVDGFFDKKITEQFGGQRSYFSVEYEDDVTDSAFEGSWVVLEDDHLIVFTDDEFTAQYEAA